MRTPNEIVAAFLASSTSPYRIVPGELVLWSDFVRDIRDWSNQQIPRKVIKAALPKCTPVAKCSGGKTYIGNIAYGHEEVRHYEAVDGYLRLVGGKPFKVQPKVAPRAPRVSPRFISFINLHCDQVGTVDLVTFRRSAARHLGLKQWWTTAYTTKQLALAGFQIVEGKILCLTLHDSLNKTAPVAATPN